ncbi:hypothetical protein DevBK_00965 [Devosia sp. BK]|uniref:hypothetical protein n=1 Tax=Devosia sp. BK TaxID=2871706 RepID=UPI00293AC5A2|nr:hypothetical protein [Devosia sp. BK]MDV3249891.1 hypothetical protein [Devosia sp. BK]
MFEHFQFDPSPIATRSFGMQPKDEEVSFLAEDFGIPAAKAAALVADTEIEADALAARQIKRERSRGPYGNAPVPASPEEHQVSDDGGLQKPVLKQYP